MNGEQSTLLELGNEFLSPEGNRVGSPLYLLQAAELEMSSLTWAKRELKSTYLETLLLFQTYGDKR